MTARFGSRFRGRLPAVTARVLVLIVASLRPAPAATVQVRVERLVAGANRPALTAMWVGFHDGRFDYFDAGQVASDHVRAAAELGDFGPLRERFAGHGADAVVGDGPLTAERPVAEVTLELDPTRHRYCSFAAMVLPSNDTFYGNDDPARFEVFDVAGRLQPLDLLLTKTDWWDAGSEFNDRSPDGGAAFIAGADAAAGLDSRGTVTPFAELSFYNGALLVNGARFETLTQMTDEFEPMVRITVVPEPSATMLVLLGCLGVWRQRVANARRVT
jgi:hypothetical protein